MHEMTFVIQQTLFKEGYFSLSHSLVVKPNWLLGAQLLTLFLEADLFQEFLHDLTDISLKELLVVMTNTKFLFRMNLPKP